MRMMLSRNEVANRLGHRPEWFARHLRDLQETRGFPIAVLGSGRAQRWDSLAIERWLDRQLDAEVRVIANDPVLDVNLENYQRARQVADGRRRSVAA